jgi:multidrug efflux pump subunit AcrA (membrane-fusion protein)
MERATLTAIESPGSDWDRIDDLLAGIAGLSKSDTSAEEFFGGTLDAAIRGLNAAGGAIWVRSEAAGMKIVAQKLPADAQPAGITAARTELVERILHSARSGALPPHCEPSADAPAGNPTGYVILVSAWLLEGEAAGVIEILQLPGAAAAVESGYLKLLEAIGELIADYQRTAHIRELRERLRGAARLENYTQAIHAHIDLQATAYAIVNEGRQLLGCDRLGLLIARGRRFRLAAISGVDKIHSRAKVVELFEELAAAAVTVDEPLWFPGDGSPQPPQVEAAIARFLDDSHARALAVLPLKTPASNDEPPGWPVGVLVVERFYGALDDRLRSESERICNTTAQAVHNARELADLPLAGLLRQLRWLKSVSALRRVGLVTAALAALVAALALIPANFTIAARGELQPQQVHDVFAQADGLIGDLNVEHGQQVRPRELLARLHRPQMDLEFKQVLGELDTARKRLASVEAERLRIPRDTEEQKRQFDQWTAQAVELGGTIHNLEEMHKILLAKQEELEVKSPMSGEVLTWNVRQSLEARPVRRGQVLLTIGDLSGPWQLELKVRDRDVSHLLAAQRELGEPLAVTYWLSSDPSQRLHGTVRQVALRTETPEAEDPSLAVTVDLAADEHPQVRAGAGVSASISCGRRSVGYVWLHDFVDAVRGWMWW